MQSGSLVVIVVVSLLVGQGRPDKLRGSATYHKVSSSALLVQTALDGRNDARVCGYSPRDGVDVQYMTAAISVWLRERLHA